MTLRAKTFAFYDSIRLAVTVIERVAIQRVKVQKIASFRMNLKTTNPNPIPHFQLFLVSFISSSLACKRLQASDTAACDREK
jgi:hypothetical protein